jgi:hypothetical protein
MITANRICKYSHGTLAHVVIRLVWSLDASAPTSADTIAVEIKHRCRTPDSNPHPQSGKGILL